MQQPQQQSKQQKRTRKVRVNNSKGCWGMSFVSSLFLLFTGFGITGEARSITSCGVQSQSMMNLEVKVDFDIKDKIDGLSVHEGVTGQGNAAASAAIVAMSTGSAKTKIHCRRAAAAKWVGRRREWHQKKLTSKQCDYIYLSEVSEDELNSTSADLPDHEVEVSSLLHQILYFYRIVGHRQSKVCESQGEVEVSSLPPPRRKTTVVAGGGPRTLKEMKTKRAGGQGPLKEPEREGTREPLKEP